MIASGEEGVGAVFGDDQLQFVANAVIDKGGARAGERSAQARSVIDSGVLSCAEECGGMWSVAGCYGYVVVDQGCRKGAGVLFWGTPMAGAKHGGERRGVAVIVGVHRQGWNAASGELA